MESNIYNPNFVKNLFNKMSNSYERMNYITSFGFSIRWRKQLINSFSKSENKVEIIDILTGMGEMWPSIKNKFPNSKLTALDFSEGMLTYANSKNKKKFNSEISILNQDILNNQLPDNHYNYITCAFGLKTFNNEQILQLAYQLKRILKPGGQISFIEVSKPKNKFLQFLYAFYLGKVIPILGRILLGNPVEYRMLWKYTQSFDNSKEACQLFKKAGFEVEYKSYFYGCSTGFIAIK